MADLSRRAGDALRALVAAGRIKSAWLRGMESMSRHRAMRVSDDGWVAFRADAFHAEEPVRFDPRTDDPLTVFGLLLLAREAWGSSGVWCEPEFDLLRWRCWSYGPGFLRNVAHGATEAEAIVAALEAAVERAA